MKLDGKYALSFVVGFLALGVFYSLTYLILWLLRRKGQIERTDGERRIGLSPQIAFIEQLLFYFAAIAGLEIFKYSVAAWLVFKGIHHWSRWGPSKIRILPEEYTQAEKLNLDPLQYREIRERSRFMVFIIGTGMSIAAGGLAGAVYHYAVTAVCN